MQPQPCAMGSPLLPWAPATPASVCLVDSPSFLFSEALHKLFPMLRALSLLNPNLDSPAFSLLRPVTAASQPNHTPSQHAAVTSSQARGTCRTGRCLIPRVPPAGHCRPRPGTEQVHMEVWVHQGGWRPAGRGGAALGARWRAWASWGLPLITGLPALTPQIPFPQDPGLYP